MFPQACQGIAILSWAGVIHGPASSWTSLAVTRLLHTTLLKFPTLHCSNNNIPQKVSSIKMFGRLFGLWSFCALSAKALVLPPGFAPATNPEALDPIVNPKHERLHIPCAACSFSFNQRDVEDKEFDEDPWIQVVPKDIVLSFTISNDGERLELNGEPIYPPHFHSNAYLHGPPIYVDQVSASLSGFDIATGEARSPPLKVTSTGLSIESDHAVSKNGDVIIPMKLQIMGLENQPVDLNEVAVDLLKTGDGELYIVKIETLAKPNSLPFPSPHGPSNESGDLKECASLPLSICKLKNMLESQLMSLRHGKFGHPRPCPGSHRRKGHKSGNTKPHSGSAETDERPYRHHGRPHNMKPFWDRHHRSHRHHFLRAFAKGIIAILIPILAGITVGLSVSFLGLLLGRMIGYMWTTFACGGRRQCGSLALEKTSQDEGKILVCEDDLEALPLYEEAPPYEEVENQQK